MMNDQDNGIAEKSTLTFNEVCVTLISSDEKGAAFKISFGSSGEELFKFPRTFLAKDDVCRIGGINGEVEVSLATDTPPPPHTAS
jgi:hypothetical protein